VSIDQLKSFIPVRIALLTVSDTRSLADDKSGSVLAERVETSGHQVVSRKLLRDDRQDIRLQLEAWVKSETG
jgi:Molybdopterin biosynthesis enzymes